MGLQIPGELADLLNELGYMWPKSDEVKLVELGQAWVGFADTLSQLRTDADGAMHKAVDEHAGPAIEAFKGKWAAEQSAMNTMHSGVTGAQVVGLCLYLCAVVVLALKVTVIVQLTILLVEIIEAIATAPVTFGGSLLEIPVFKKICDLAINYLISKAMEAVLG
jgi:hypothetical protein